MIGRRPAMLIFEQYKITDPSCKIRLEPEESFALRIRRDRRNEQVIEPGGEISDRTDHSGRLALRGHRGGHRA